MVLSCVTLNKVLCRDDTHSLCLTPRDETSTKWVRRWKCHWKVSNAMNFSGLQATWVVVRKHWRGRLMESIVLARWRLPWKRQRRKWRRCKFLFLFEDLLLNHPNFNWTLSLRDCLLIGHTNNESLILAKVHWSLHTHNAIPHKHFRIFNWHKFSFFQLLSGSHNNWILSICLKKYWTEGWSRGWWWCKDKILSFLFLLLTVKFVWVCLVMFISFQLRKVCFPLVVRGFMGIRSRSEDEL